MMTSVWALPPPRHIPGIFPFCILLEYSISSFLAPVGGCAEYSWNILYQRLPFLTVLLDPYGGCMCAYSWNIPWIIFGAPKSSCHVWWEYSWNILVMSYDFTLSLRMLLLLNTSHFRIWAVMGYKNIPGIFWTKSSVEYSWNIPPAASGRQGPPWRHVRCVRIFLEYSNCTSHLW